LKIARTGKPRRAAVLLINGCASDRHGLDALSIVAPRRALSRPIWVQPSGQEASN
jgi:hypothetical protein